MQTFSIRLVVNSNYYINFEPTHESIRVAGAFVVASMETWCKIRLSVTPKENIFEDHAIESMRYLNGLGDKTK